MANSLRIIKADGTSHIVPLKTLNNHRKLERILPPSQRSRFEEIDEAGKVIAVHNEGARAEAIAGQNEIARLKAEVEKYKTLASNAEKGPIGEVIEKINAATTLQEIQAISLSDGRPEVMKAAAKKIKSLPKE